MSENSYRAKAESVAKIMIQIDKIRDSESQNEKKAINSQEFVPAIFTGFFSINLSTISFFVNVLPLLGFEFFNLPRFEATGFTRILEFLMVSPS